MKWRAGPTLNRARDGLELHGQESTRMLASELMFKILVVVCCLTIATMATELPSKKYLNVSAVKKMVAAAEAKADELHVQVTICIVDENGTLLFLQKGDNVTPNTIQWAQRKARHAAFYRKPSREAVETIKKGEVQALAYPEFFPNQGGLPILIDGQILGGIAASGARSELDEAVAQAGLDALQKP